MNAIKVAFALWTVVAVSSLTTLIFGNGGLLALHKLEAERDRLSENMEELRHLNAQLQGALGELQSDPDVLTVYAHELGYAASEDERFVRIAEVSSAPRSAARAGNLLRAVRPTAFSDSAIRVLAATAGLILIVLLFRPAIRSSGRAWSIRRRGKRPEGFRAPDPFRT
jgi:cell division protein FtsB